jgi:hypothetical protein
MWLKWLPWRYLVRRASNARGFIDPISVLNAVHRFAQPSEVAQPTELLRAGVIMHARGLMNTQAIQHNLDWIWPHWIQRQFNPDDIAFIPRAFSITHVNLTHRNWTAVGLPGLEEMPIVDPSGLVTPFFDSWSIDYWIIPPAEAALIPSKAENLKQHLEVWDTLKVSTQISQQGLDLLSSVFVVESDDYFTCIINLSAQASNGGDLVVSIRPFNPEGVSFLHSIEVDKERRRWRVDEERGIYFSEPADRVSFSRYRDVMY